MRGLSSGARGARAIDLLELRTVWSRSKERVCLLSETEATHSGQLAGLRLRDQRAPGIGDEKET